MRLTNCEDLEVIICDKKGQKAYFYGQRKEKRYPLISAMTTSKLLCQGYIEY